jgi:hypothetical protein
MLVYFYTRRARVYRRVRTEAHDLWWLPGWNVWRVVIRNIGGSTSLHELRWRVWYRHVEPPKPGCSVSTFVDTELDTGERHLLLVDQDIPILCFRFEKRNGVLVFVRTDKLGNVRSETNVGRTDQVLAEYNFTVEDRFKIPYTVTRLLELPRQLDSAKGSFDLFDYLFKSQVKPEHSVPLLLTSDEHIGIPVPS